MGEFTKQDKYSPLNKLKIIGYTRKKLFKSFVLIFLIPSFIISIFSGYIAFKKTIEQNISEKMYISSTLANSYQQAKESISYLANDISYFRWVEYMMMHNNGYNRYDLNEKSQDLRILKNSNPCADFIAIFFHEKNIVITSSGISEINSFNNDVFRIGNMGSIDWLNLNNPKNYQAQDKAVEVSIYDDKISGDLFVKPISIALGEYTSRATIFIFSKKESISKIIKPYTDIENMVFYKVNGNTSYFQVTSEKEKTILDAIEKQKNNNKTAFRIEEDYVFFVEGSEYNTKYALFTPMERVYQGVGAVMILTISFLSILLVLSFLFAYKLSLLNYQPLKNLVEFFKNHLNEAQDESSLLKDDEYKFLKNAAEKVIGTNEELSEKLVINSKQIIAGDLLKIINNIPISQEKYKHIENTFRQSWFSFISVQKIKGESASEKTDLFKKLELLLNNMNFSYFKIILNYDEYVLNFENMDDLTQLINILKNDKQYHKNYTFNFGTAYQGIINLRVSYLEAQATAKYRSLHISEHVSIYNETTKNNFYFYPIDVEYELTSFLTSGNSKKTIDLFKKLYDENLKMKTVSIKGLNLFFSDIILTIAKVSKHHSVYLSTKLERYLDSEKTVSDDLYDEICNHIINLCDTIIKEKELIPEKKWQSIFDFVNQNIYSPELSLQMIANEFDISISYASVLFKEKTGKNFVDYVNIARINKSKLVLKDKNLDIVTVAIKCGFLNDSTYRRLFKKYVGCSPSEYRKTLV